MTTSQLWRRLLAVITTLALAIGLASAPARAAVGNDVSNAVRYAAGPAPIGEIIEDLSDEDDDDEDVALPFPVNYFGLRAEALCISTNGLIFPIESVGDGCSDRYDRSVEVLAATAGAPAIAALAADISLDSSDNDYDGFDGIGIPGNIYYGETTIDGKPAVAITYYRVKMFGDDNDSALENTFQIILMQNGGTEQAGYDFLIEFNYGQVKDGEEGYSKRADGFTSCDSDEAADCRWGVGLASVGEDGPEIAITNSTPSFTPSGAVGVYEFSIDPMSLDTSTLPAGAQFWIGDGVQGWEAEFLSSSAPGVMRMRVEGANLPTAEQFAALTFVSQWGSTFEITAREIISERAADADYAGYSKVAMRLTSASAHGVEVGDIVFVSTLDGYTDLTSYAGRRWRVSEVFSATEFEASVVTSFNRSSTNILDGAVTGWSFREEPTQSYELFAGAERDSLLDGAENALTAHSMNSPVLGRYMYSIVNGEITNWDEVFPDPEAPAAPQNVTATRIFNTVSLTWQAPAQDGGSDITGYTVTVQPTGESCVTTVHKCVFDKLALGVTYTFSVVATNAIGDSEAAVSNSVFLPAPRVEPAPREPEYLTVFFRDGSTTLTSKAKAKLDQIAAKVRSAKTVYIIGHTSKFESTNLTLRALSKQRAKAVSRYLWRKNGTVVHVLWANGAKNLRSEDQPFKNRRVRLKLTW